MEKKEKEKNEINNTYRDQSMLIRAIKTGDEDIVIDILPRLYCNFNFGNFYEIYRTVYFEYELYNSLMEEDVKISLPNLLEDINSKFVGRFKDLLRAIFLNPIDYDCEQIHEAIKGRGMKEDTLIEIFGTRSKEAIKGIKRRYPEKYNKKTLLKEIKKNTSGFFKDLLISIIESVDMNDTNEDNNTLRHIADLLDEDCYNSREQRDKLFMKVFTKTSKNDLDKIIFFYEEIKILPMNKLIDKNFSLDSRKLLKAIYYREANPYKFFAKKIHQALSGLFKVDKNLLIRIIATQKNKGRDYLDKIECCYNMMYHSQLFEDINKKLKGNFCDLVLKLLCD